MKKDHIRARRLSFPEDEKMFSWLTMLIDALYIVDKGVTKAIELERKKGRRLACRKGCSNCCRTHRDIPVYPLEIMGISWYVCKKIISYEQNVLRNQLMHFSVNKPCPFLINGKCSIHPVRPMACRQFNVFNKACDEGEDPFYTRPEDLLPPVKKYIDQAFFIMLPFHGIKKDSDRIKAIESRLMHKMVKNLKECNWRLLIERMEIPRSKYR